MKYAFVGYTFLSPEAIISIIIHKLNYFLLFSHVEIFPSNAYLIMSCLFATVIFCGYNTGFNCPLFKKIFISHLYRVCRFWIPLHILVPKLAVDFLKNLS